jgi:hypothetical protein
VGIATGAISGIVVLDIDPRHGGDDALDDLQGKHGKLPDTVEALTGGGGRHIIMRHPGGRVQNSAGALGRGLDIRGDGGYIIAPPSLHVSGRSYEWEGASRPDEVEIATMPAWLVALVADAPSGKRASQAAWRQATGRVVPEGGRNHTLASFVGTLLGRGVPSDAVWEAAVCWNATKNRPPLDDAELSKVVDSIAKREAKRRRGGSDV